MPETWRGVVQDPPLKEFVNFRQKSNPPPPPLDSPDPIRHSTVNTSSEKVVSCRNDTNLERHRSLRKAVIFGINFVSIFMVTGTTRCSAQSPICNLSLALSGIPCDNLVEQKQS